MTSEQQQQQDLSSDRVCGQSGTNIDHLECCICHKLLWKPVACQTCETSFCSACISRWLMKSPNKCPHQCEPYIERRCPPLTAKLLSQLQIMCSYQCNGCPQIISYETLEKHEIGCDYQPQQCPGCRSQMVKKDFINHVNECIAIELTCDDCKMVYKRGEASMKHTENKCLKEQLRQVRDECKEMRVVLNCIVMTITFNDLPHVNETSQFPDIYKGLRWTQFRYINKAYALEKHPKSGYVTACISEASPYIIWSCKESEVCSGRRDETFTLISLTAYAAWNDNLQLTITGYRNSIQVNNCTITLLYGKPQRIVFGWKNVDQVIFEPSGGTPHSASSRSYSSSHFVLSQLTIC